MYFSACNCHTEGSLSATCDVFTGQCDCENNFGGRDCASCEDGYYEFDECKRKSFSLHATSLVRQSTLHFKHVNFSCRQVVIVTFEALRKEFVTRNSDLACALKAMAGHGEDSRI